MQNQANLLAKHKATLTKLAIVVIAFIAGHFLGQALMQKALDDISNACANGGWIFDAGGNKYSCKFVGK